MEIRPTDNRRDNKTKIKKKKQSSTIKGDHTFSKELQNNIAAEFHGSIDELMSDLKEHERRFLDNQTLYELNMYKDLIQTILKKIIEDGFETKTLLRSRRDRADFTIINDINSKLAAISTAITRQNKAFNLLKAFDEIRGLVFDLLY